MTGRNGGVLDPVSGETLLPGEPGYAEAARSSANLLNSSGSELQIKNQAIKSFSFDVEAGLMLAPLIINSTTQEEYFLYAAANRDGLQHYTGYGANGWGVEDLFGLGDADYDDMIVRFSLEG